ncbi:MAG: type VII toxin-antitoxin system MntA family adenylyltransferase antitoxin [Chloroflexota bacterium]
MIRSFLIERSSAEMVFVFGSVMRGRQGPESDVDVAVLFEKVPTAHRLQSLRDDLSGLLGREVDIVVLNTASPIVRMQVLKHGTLVHKASESTFTRFFVQTVNEYYDLKQIRRQCEEEILRGRIYA